MPFYTFKCPKCNKEKTELRTIGDFTEPYCVGCSRVIPRIEVYMKKIMGNTGRPIFKGDGFYETDYKKKKEKKK